MKLIRTISLVIVATTASLCAAQTDPHSHATATAPMSMPGKPGPDMARMDAQLKTMQDMHARMAAAKTPVERRALMAGQMKVMQDSMMMMGDMHSQTMAAMPAGMQGGMHDGMQGNMAAHRQMMETHMQMMQMHMQMMQAMMQLMLDRMAAGG